MKRKFRIRCVGNRESVTKFVVEMRWLFFWITIQTFTDDDMEFAFREAEELLQVLGGNEIMVPKYAEG